MRQGNMIQIFGISFLLTLVMAFLFHVIDASKVNWLVGLTHGFYIGIAFIVTSMGVTYQYERRSYKLWAINGGYQLVFLMVMGAILGAWY